MSDDQPQITRLIAAECDEWRTKCGELAAECERLKESLAEVMIQVEQYRLFIADESVRAETIKHLRRSLDYNRVTIANLSATQAPTWARDAARVWYAKRGEVSRAD